MWWSWPLWLACFLWSFTSLKASFKRSISSAETSSPFIALSKPSNLVLVTGFISIAINGGSQNIGVGIRRAGNNVNGAMGGLTGFASAKSNRRARHSETMHNGDFGISSLPIHFIDQPNTTDMLRYYPQFTHGSSSTRTIFINRSDADSDNAEKGRNISILTAQEIVTWAH